MQSNLVSQNKLIGLVLKTPSKARNDLSHTNSDMAATMDCYSASAEDWEIVGCFFAFQESEDAPNWIK